MLVGPSAVPVRSCNGRFLLRDAIRARLLKLILPPQSTPLCASHMPKRFATEPSRDRTVSIFAPPFASNPSFADRHTVQVERAALVGLSGKMDQSVPTRPRPPNTCR